MKRLILSLCLVLGAFFQASQLSAATSEERSATNSSATITSPALYNTAAPAAHSEASEAIHSASARPESSPEARLLRFPTVGGGRIVFCYAGDLYSVPVTGGSATKLTSHIGYECFPKISPDGQTIAFTAQYDGNTEVYTIPITGGTPRRLTYSALVSRDQVGERMGPNNIVMNWTPDGKHIIYRSKQWNISGLRGTLCKVSIDGGTPEIIPTSEGGFCSYSPDGKQLALNRMFREFRTWKYYRGGQADDIWINEVGTTKLSKITDNPAQDIFPMWVGSEIYYLSDRDRTMNLFCYDTASKQTRKVTDFTEYDCKFPSASQSQIVFENGGYIYLYDTLTGGKAQKISITLASDGSYSRSEYRNISSDLSGYTLSPDGKRILAIARGDIYSLPAGSGPVVNLSKSPGSHEREVRWSPDGKHIAWISDASGEYQIYLAPSDNPQQAKQMTFFTEGYPTSLQFSPDGSRLYWSAITGDIYELNIATASYKAILTTSIDGISNFRLSPDGTWAVYTENLPNYISAVFLYEFATGRSYQVTDRWYDASSPLFSSDGRYLFFTSAEVFSAQYLSMEWNAGASTSSHAFMLPLSASTPNPLLIKSDEYAPASQEAAPQADSKASPKAKSASKTQAGKASSPKAKPAAMQVDLTDIASRIIKLPIEAGNIRFYYATPDKLYFIGGGARAPRAAGSPTPGLKVLDLSSGTISEGPSVPVAVTANYKTALVRSDGLYKITKFESSPGKSSAALPTQEVDMIIDHEAEWAQIFDESWRITRDNFYVANMHGADWPHVREKYAALLPYVKHREDLSYIIGEMLGELNAGHAYITSGETTSAPRVPTGLLGAKYSKDPSTGAFRLDKIFRGATWDASLRSPLRESGIDAQEGEYLTNINGIPASQLQDPGQALIGKAGKTVALTISKDPAGKNSRTVYLRPISDESQLAYYEWVKGNIEKVEQLSGGEIGYIHIPDMSSEGLLMFARLYYNQLDRKALIIDDRMNGGGNVSPIILERLQREVYRMNMYRNYNINQTVPNQAFYGPKVCLIDKYSSSDGDLFPYGFRKLGLGKLIGTRSWGGIVGISGSRPFLDGQDMRTPFFTSYSTEGEWIIEGHGVDPDIVVDINPFEDYLGRDAQLEKAVEVLKEELKSYKPLPRTPAAAPVKN